jgi:alpha-tubulin suppressor-like RCC1 family protein
MSLQDYTLTREKFLKGEISLNEWTAYNNDLINAPAPDLVTFANLDSLTAIAADSLTVSLTSLSSVLEASFTNSLTSLSASLAGSFTTSLTSLSSVLEASFTNSLTSLSSVLEASFTNSLTSLSSVLETSFTNSLTSFSSSFATSLTSIDSDKLFLRFSDIDSYVGVGTLYRTTAFISKTNKLWVAGYGGGDSRLGLGNVDYADQGYHQVVAVNLLAGEYIVKHYLQRFSQYFLTNLGNIYSTGYNAYGQLGLGDTTNRYVFERITGVSNVTHFSCDNGSDETHGTGFCTAVSDGKLYAWGYNGQTRLGTNDSTQRNSPVLITLGSIATKTIVKAYAIGDTYTAYGYIAAIDSDKNIHFCGQNGAGQFGIAAGDFTTRSTFVQHPTMLVDKYLAAMYNGAAVSFILYNGKLFTAGGYDTANQYGQLGNNGTTARQTFAEVIIPGKTFKSIAVCDYYGGSVAAIMNDDTLWTWGRNNQGHLGHGTTTNALIPVNTGLTNIVKVLGVDNNYCFFAALNSSGELYVSGYNGHGQKGIGTTAQNNYFSKVIKPADLKFVDFTCWGWNSGIGWTAADQYGNLWSCGYGGQWTTGRRHANNSNPYVVTRCNVNL